MDLEAILINVEYDKQANLTNSLLPVKKIDTIYSNDPALKRGTKLGFAKEGENWITFSHCRGPVNGYYQIAFRVHNETSSEKAIVCMNSPGQNGLSAELFYYEKEGCWFELSRFEKNKENYASTPVGMQHAGEIEVFVKNENGEITVQPKTVVFLPASVSKNEYEKMLDELSSIRLDLIAVSNAKAKVSAKVKKMPLPELVQKCLDQIDFPLKRIIQNPTSALNQVWTKVPYKLNCKMKAKTLCEIAIYHSKPKYSIAKYNESHDTYENQMIKFALRRLVKILENYQEETRNRHESDRKMRRKMLIASLMLIENKMVQRNMSDDEEIIDAMRRYIEKERQAYDEFKHEEIKWIVGVLLLTPDVPRLTVFGVRELTEMQSGRRRVSPAQTHLSVIPFLLRIPA